VRPAPTLAEISIREFLGNLDSLTAIYAAAMAPPPLQLPGRRAILERHAGYRAFRAIVAATASAAAANAGPASPGTASPGTVGSEAGTEDPRTTTSGPGPGRAPGGGVAAGRLVGFAYGFHGEAGQWWHDLVMAALAKSHGRRAARAWMNDSFEIAEVHVHPDYQGRGTGHAMLARLAAGRTERTAVLSTMDADTSAHRLYRGMGFADLLPGFVFPGADQPYVIMGATLPLELTLPRAHGERHSPGAPLAGSATH
jgi:GNAT superfamily N-acetyltransferase